jgi:protein-S-isoprenylcysteine O-methyltransferase Ste14
MTTPAQEPAWLTRWLTLRAWLSEDLGGGPRPFTFATVINLQKGGTLPFVLALIALTGDTGPTLLTYAALHGSYGLIWLLKDRLFPDPGWEKPVTLGGAVASWLGVLGPYWVAPVVIALDPSEAPPWLLAAATLLYALGLFWMVGADAQKYFSLRLRRGLVTEGFFAWVRHPNYLGEMMIYASFALLARHPAPWMVLGVVWSLVFLPNILRKEASMSRYPEWSAYAARTGLLLPWRLFTGRRAQDSEPATLAARGAAK